MKVILIEDVPPLGKAGEVVQVAPGYGRNFLIPKNLALGASSANLRLLERQRESLLKKADHERKSAADLARKIENLACTFTRQVGENEKLFGSVTRMDLQEFLSSQGIPLDRRRILLATPIKSTGRFTVPVKLPAEIVANLKVNILAAVGEKKKA